MVASEPREGLYRFVHPHRLQLKGLKKEAKAWVKAQIRGSQPKPFLIYGRPRSGTTLLVNLLQQLSDTICDRELLHDFILRPKRFLRDLPRGVPSDTKAYGLKLLSYQLMEVQQVHRPLAFFDALCANGYTIFHLTRDTWGQTMSLTKAQATGIYFGEMPDTELELDPKVFVASLRWNRAMLDYERTIMAHVPHTPLNYDTNLKQPAEHQGTVDIVCDALGLASVEVKATLQRTGGKGGSPRVVNLDEIVDYVHAAGLGQLVPPELTA